MASLEENEQPSGSGIDWYGVTKNDSKRKLDSEFQSIDIDQTESSNDTSSIKFFPYLSVLKISFQCCLLGIHNAHPGNNDVDAFVGKFGESSSDEDSSFLRTIAERRARRVIKPVNRF